MRCPRCGQSLKKASKQNLLYVAHRIKETIRARDFIVLYIVIQDYVYMEARVMSKPVVHEKS